MLRQKLFLSTAIFGLLVSNSNYSMNEQITPIKLDNGLLTLVPDTSTHLKVKGFFNLDYFIGETKKPERLSTLASLLSIAKTTIDDYDGKSEKFLQKFIFCPTIVRVEEDNSLKNLGSLSASYHEEAKEACRERKALFYPYQQGLILYSLNKLDSNLFETKKIELEKMVMENRNKQLEILVPVYYPTK